MKTFNGFYPFYKILPCLPFLIVRHSPTFPYMSMLKMVKQNAKFRFRNGSWVNTPLNTLEDLVKCMVNIGRLLMFLYFALVLMARLSTLLLFSE